jgi:hypothetical protein
MNAKAPHPVIFAALLQRRIPPGWWMSGRCGVSAHTHAATPASTCAPSIYFPLPQTRVLTWSYLVPINAFMLVVPHPLLCDWGHDTVPLVKSLADTRNFITFSFFAGLTVMVLHLLRSVLRTRARSPATFIGVCWAAITFLPASNLFFPVGFVVADRVLYTPSMGSCILLAHAANVLYFKSVSKQSKFTNLLRLLLLSLIFLLLPAYFARTWIRYPLVAPAPLTSRPQALCPGTSTGTTVSTCGPPPSGSPPHTHAPPAFLSHVCRVNSGNPKFWLGLAHAKGEEGTKGLEEVSTQCRVATLVHVILFSAGNRFPLYRRCSSRNLCGGILQSRHQRVPGA